MHPSISRAHQFDDQVVIPALGQQLTLLGFEPEPAVLAEGTYFDGKRPANSPSELQH
ncbi:hypothetical protein P4N66_gene4985 [Pseudomonas aeruginosa]|uniref:hypothetical protein n=1 Tax=Pseudomonas aeruginosa TaxID=287 RepID=UPI001C240F7D|nr:hypothetical protein [Pseudomonas aeruginosa]QCO95714.1 Hypothetical protein [Pseudomonas aeruginosa]WGT18881.1 hypothetical protein P4N66_gene4985 [Pseudomonas aeruginosa]